jgi:nitroreductase
LAIAAAAEVGVDATPIEGFTPPEVDKILGLAEQGLKSVVLLPLGYRDAANDWNVNLKKYRKAKEELVVEIK